MQKRGGRESQEKGEQIDNAKKEEEEVKAKAWEKAEETDFA